MKPYIIPNNIEEMENKAIPAALESYAGLIVCVSQVSNRDTMRNCFEPQISVQGTLEILLGTPDTDEEGIQCRIVVDDNNYTYFDAPSVWMITHDDGKRPVILIDHKDQKERQPNVLRKQSEFLCATRL